MLPVWVVEEEMEKVANREGVECKKAKQEGVAVWVKVEDTQAEAERVVTIQGGEGREGGGRGLGGDSSRGNGTGGE